MKLTSALFLIALFVGMSVDLLAQTSPRLRSAWKYALPAAGDGLMAADDKLAVAADEKGNVAAINIESGEAVWTTKLAGSPSSPPAMTADLILIGADDGTLHALARADGKPQWTAKAEGKIVGQPLITGERVVFGSYDTRVYAAGLSDGNVAWRFVTEAQVHAPIAPLGKLLLTAGCDTQLRALDSAGGQVWAAELSGAVAAPPLVHEDSVFVASMDATVLRADEKGNVTWRQSLPDTGAISLGPVLLSGRLLVISDDGKLAALEPRTGEILSTTRLTGGPASALAYGEHLLVGTDEGRVLVLDGNGRTISRITLGGSVKRLCRVGERVVAATDQGAVWLLK